MKKILSMIILTFMLVLSAFGLSACGHEHAYVDTIVAPTCVDKGYTLHKCECGESYIDTEVNALGHDFGDYVSDNNATYTSDGTMTATCKRSGCTATDTVSDDGSMLESYISFKTLNVEGTDASIVLPNATTIFDFKEEINKIGVADFVISLDEFAQVPIITKTVSLAEGNNTIYVFETVGESIKKYTVVIRRKPMYTVSFNTVDGTVIAPQEIEEGYTATMPTTIPEREGYNFTGWEFDFDTIITGDVIVNAQWNYFTVKTSTTDSLAGSYSMHNFTKVSVGETVNLTATANAGYNFIGWYDENGLVSSNANYSFEMTEQNVVLTAKWNYFTVTTKTFDAEAGTYTVYNNTKISVGDTVNLTATTNNGYNFLGWYNGEDLVSANANYSFEMTEQNVVLTAKWNYFTVTTSTNLQGAGTYSTYNNTKISVGETVNLTATTNNGYNFLGWYNGEDLVSSNANYSFEMTEQNVVLTAKWNYFTVTTKTFDAESGTYTVYNNTKISVGETVNLTATANAGYNFIGWYDENGLVSSNANYSFEMTEQNVVLTAKWEIIVYAISYDLNGGTFIGEYPTTYTVKDYDLTAPTIEGDFEFYKWQDESGNFIESLFGITRNITLRATWNSTVITSYGSEITGLTEYGETLQEIVIPSENKGVAINSIGGSAFSSCDSLQSIEIPASVTSIGEGAFNSERDFRKTQQKNQIK